MRAADVVRGKDRRNAGLEDLGAGRFALRCDLTFATVTSILNESERLFAPHESIGIDMSGVAQADTAGLALLLEWLSRARDAGRQIAYENIPPQISAVAEISEVAELLRRTQGSGAD